MKTGGCQKILKPYDTMIRPQETITSHIELLHFSIIPFIHKSISLLGSLQKVRYKKLLRNIV